MSLDYIECAPTELLPLMDIMTACTIIGVLCLDCLYNDYNQITKG